MKTSAEDRRWALEQVGLAERRKYRRGREYWTAYEATGTIRPGRTPTLNSIPFAPIRVGACIASLGKTIQLCRFQPRP